MEIIKFIDIKARLQKSLEDKMLKNPILGENGFTLIDGFMTFSLNGELSSNLIIGGPSIPMVGIVGNTTGRIYTFALKILLPDLKL